MYHDDVIKWKHFPRYWSFVRGIHRSPVNSPHKGQWRGALMFSLICARINGWVNNGEAGDLRRYRAHYDVIVMTHLAQSLQALESCQNGAITNQLWLTCETSALRTWPDGTDACDGSAGTARSRYTTDFYCYHYCCFFTKYSPGTPHSSPMRVRYEVPFVISKSELYFFITAMHYTPFCWEPFSTVGSFNVFVKFHWVPAAYTKHFFFKTMKTEHVRYISWDILSRTGWMDPWDRGAM